MLGQTRCKMPCNHFILPLGRDLVPCAMQAFQGLNDNVRIEAARADKRSTERVFADYSCAREVPLCRLGRRVVIVRGMWEYEKEVKIVGCGLQ